MPGIINTGTHPKLLWPGVHAIWGQVYNEHQVEYTDLYETMDSNQAYEEDMQVRLRPGPDQAGGTARQLRQ